MRNFKVRSARVIAVQAAFLVSAATAMTMPHYRVSSLVYMSTDIVIANIAEDEQHKLCAVVTEVLYGSLHTQDRINGLSPFLNFFQPMAKGMRVVLFLDRRPRPYDFFNADASKAPFAVPPSGVYLIDEYDHVHEYFQQNNPGPYVAQGYSFFNEQRAPTKEQDLILPSLDFVKEKIATAVQDVNPIRPLLTKGAAFSDVPALLHLLDQTSDNDKDCELRDEIIAITAMRQALSLKDPELALKAYAISGHFDIEGFADPARVTYLANVIADTKKDLALRVAAIEILLNLSRFRNGPSSSPFGTLPLDNNWVKEQAVKIQATSKSIFDDSSESARLRSLCLRFLPLHDQSVIDDLRRVYVQTTSTELRFAIEDALLRINDSLYQSLNPPGGPIASLITAAKESACSRKGHSGTAFVLEYRQRKDFEQHRAFARPGYRLTDLKTGKDYVVAQVDVHVLWGWSGQSDGQSKFELVSFGDVPEGKYSLAFQSSLDSKVISVGYGTEVVIHKSPKGNVISLSNPRQK